VGVVTDIPPGTQADFLAQSHALTFADIVTQEPQGEISTFDAGTGLGSVIVPNIDPGLWAVAAACVVGIQDPDDLLAGIAEAIAVAAAIAEADALPLGMEPDIFDPAFIAHLQENAPTWIQELVTFAALGVQLFTIDQACSDAAECQDGDVCNGLEVCAFDETAETDICQDPTEAVACSGVSAKKYIVIDKLTAAGKAKTVYVAKDSGATKGSGTDVNGISVDFKGTYRSTAGAFVLPAGESVNKSPGWVVNKDKVAKYVNKDSPGGPTETKVAVIKPGKLLKLITKGLGDGPVHDLIGQGAPNGASVFTRYLVSNGGENNAQCTEFASCSYKEIGGGTGRKLVCKGGAADPACQAGD
jgi:hypothetical protein